MGGKGKGKILGGKNKQKAKEAKGTMQRVQDEWMQRSELGDAILDAMADIVMALSRSSSLPSLQEAAVAILDFVFARAAFAASEKKRVLAILRIVHGFAIGLPSMLQPRFATDDWTWVKRIAVMAAESDEQEFKEVGGAVNALH